MMVTQTNNVIPAFLLFAMVIGLAIGLAIAALICYLISDALAKVPAQYHQNITPGQVWLLMIPFFNFYWNFVVYQRVPDTFKAYFEATGRPQPGDYGKQMGLIYSILICCCIIPCVNTFCGIAALVLMIILLVKFTGYKSMIIAGGGGGFPPIMPPPTP
jgi:hypothetical protein